MPSIVGSLVLSSFSFLAPLQVPEVQRLAWTSTGQLFGRTEAGRFTPHHGGHVVLQRGDEVVLLYAPHLHGDKDDSDAFVLATGASSFAVYPDTSGAGLDSILIATAAGLELLHYLGGVAPPVFQSELLAGTAVAHDALDLVCTELNGDGVPDVVAADWEGGKVELLFSQGGGYVSGGSFRASGTVSNLDLLQWDYDGAYDLAVLSSWGTEVYDLLGERLWWRASPAPAGMVHCMAVVAAPDTYPLSVIDALAFVQPNAAGTSQTLSLARVSGMEVPIQLGALDVVALDAGDRDGDGDQDLVLSVQSSRRLKVFRNRTGLAGATFTSGASFELAIGEPEGEPSPSNQADPCVADLDGDGAAEIVCGAQENGWVVILPDDLTAEEPEGPCSYVFLQWDLRSGDHDRNAAYGDAWAASQGGVELKLRNENVWSFTDQTHLELILWHEPPSAMGVEPIACLHAVYELPLSGDFQSGNLDVFIGFQVPVLMVGTPDALPDLFHDRYYLEVRPVRYDQATGAVSHGLESRCAGFTHENQNQSPSHTVLQGKAGASQCDVLPLLINGVVVESGNLLVGFVPELRIPPKQPKVLPTIEAPRETWAQVTGGSGG